MYTCTRNTGLLAVQLNQRTDYALRLLVYLALRDEPTPIGEVAASYGVSEHHLAKVAHRLRELGYLGTVRGRHGGFRLAMTPDEIHLGEVVRHMEDLRLVECFDVAQNQCRITGACELRRVLRDAQRQFMAVLDAHTLADLVEPRHKSLNNLLRVAER